MGRIPIWFAWGALFALLATGAAPAAQASKDDEKLSKQIAKLDELFVKALSDLAQKYDLMKDPEAAHFLASCALGFGGKDPKIAPIKAGWELDLFIGKVRGGQVLKDTNPIDTALRGPAGEYKKLVDSLVETAKRRGLAESTKAILHDCAIRYELAHRAHHYIQAIQRFNALRRAMGLKAVLWDFETSSKLIPAAWYTAETGDWEYEAPQKDSTFYSGVVEFAKVKATRVCRPLRNAPDILRPFALIREQLLNPNARRLWLAHWGDGSLLDGVVVYAIPQLPYREDIPTPSRRYKDETMVKDWVDTEETVEIDGKKVPFVRYPYPDEPDAPWAFANGNEGMEGNWASSEHEFLGKAGVPIMLRFFTEGSVVKLEATLKDRKGTLLPCRAYLNGDKRVVLDTSPTVLLVPEKQLKVSTAYTVAVKCTLKGTAFEKSWTFTTRAK